MANEKGALAPAHSVRSLGLAARQMGFQTLFEDPLDVRLVHSPMELFTRLVQGCLPIGFGLGQHPDHGMFDCTWGGLLDDLSKFTALDNGCHLLARSHHHGKACMHEVKQFVGQAHLMIAMTRLI